MHKPFGKALAIMALLFAFILTGCRSSNTMCPAFGSKAQSFELQTGPKIKYDKHGRIKK